VQNHEKIYKGVLKLSSGNKVIFFHKMAASGNIGFWLRLKYNPKQALLELDPCAKLNEIDLIFSS